MKIALLEHYGKYRAGDVIDLPNDEAQCLIDTGSATSIEQPAKVSIKSTGAEKAPMKRSK